MISIEKAITSKNPDFFARYPRVFSKLLLGFLKSILHEQEVNSFLASNADLEGFDFIEAVLEYLDIGYTVKSSEKENIPPTGKVVIIANHPLGALDALALIKLVGEVRSDIKIVANDILTQIKPLGQFLLPLDLFSQTPQKESVKKIIDSLHNEEALIIFPSGEVSRARPNGIKDTKWKSGFLRFAKKADAPILPVYIQAKNSYLFYGTSMLYRPLSTLLLVNEMFKKRSQTIHFKVGELIPQKSLDLKGINLKTQTNLLKKHLYRISTNKQGIFATQKCIAHQESPKEVRKELQESRCLGSTHDNKKIFLYDSDKISATLKEIGRLREYTFRKVGEGSGRRRDIDEYDLYYRHLVVWDDEELEIVGAYRIGESNKIMGLLGMEGFYTYSLFDFSEEFIPYLNNSIELGRSFVQPKYWGSRALDYLWQGLGAYLKNHPHIQYMFGPVSLSNSYPKLAKEMIIYFYSLYFGAKNEMVLSKNRYLIDKKSLSELARIYRGDSYIEDFRTLKEHLAQMDATVPTLYKHYSELCEEGGVRFLDFGIDKEFGECVDGFILVDIQKIKESKKKRYMK